MQFAFQTAPFAPLKTLYQGNTTQSVVSTKRIKTFERTARGIGIDEREIPIIAKFLEELRKLSCDRFEDSFRRRIEGAYFTPERNQKDYEFNVLGSVIARLKLGNRASMVSPWPRTRENSDKRF